MGDEPTRPEGSRPRPTLPALASVFARFANATFGGGSATIAVLREQLVVKRGWLDPSEFELSYALSRLTPGTNLLAFCTAAGWTTRRGRGAIVALLAASVPCSVFALVMTICYQELAPSAWFQAALSGALAASVAIMISTAWVFAEPHVKQVPWKAAAIVPGAAALTLGAELSPLKVLGLAAVVGLAWPTRAPQEPAA
jgi:chromate transporter